MPQNTSYLSADRIIRQGMRYAGLLEAGDDPSSEEYADHLNNLNDVIGLWQTQGLKLWTNVDQAVPLTAGKATYTLGPTGDVIIQRPLRCVFNLAYYLDVNSIRRPLIALSRDEYTRLSQTTQLGAVNSFFWDKQQTQASVTFWLTPDAVAATGVAHLIIQSHIVYVSSLIDTINFPDEWYSALCWGLADDICTGQPQAIMDRCAAKATIFRQMLEDWDTEEAPTFFQPDMRMGGHR